MIVVHNMVCKTEKKKRKTITTSFSVQVCKQYFLCKQYVFISSAMPLNQHQIANTLKHPLE